MARKSTIKIEGLEELKKKLAKIDNTAQVTLNNASEEVARAVLNTAITLAPKDTGALRESLDMKKEKTKEGKFSWQVYSAGKNDGGVRYAFVHEFGTSKIQARPFMRPAISKNKKLILKTFMEGIKKSLEG